MIDDHDQFDDFRSWHQTDLSRQCPHVCY